MLTAQATHIDTRKELMELEKKSFSNRTNITCIPSNKNWIEIFLFIYYNASILLLFTIIFFETFYKFFDSEEIKTIFRSNF